MYSVLVHVSCGVFIIKSTLDFCLSFIAAWYASVHVSCIWMNTVYIELRYTWCYFSVSRINWFLCSMFISPIALVRLEETEDELVQLKISTETEKQRKAKEARPLSKVEEEGELDDLQPLENGDGTCTCTCTYVCLAGSLYMF